MISRQKRKQNTFFYIPKDTFQKIATDATRAQICIDFFCYGLQAMESYFSKYAYDKQTDKPKKKDMIQMELQNLMMMMYLQMRVIFM